MPEQAPKSRDDLFIRRVHFPAGLKFEARHLPGGIKTMIYLAWLSKEEKVRNVAALWNRLPWKAKLAVELEELCQAAGIGSSRFLATTLATALELGIDVSGVLLACDQMPDLLSRMYKKATSSRRQLWEAYRAGEFLLNQPWMW